MYQVQKRDGKVTDFDISKITAAISKAFDALEKQYHPSTIDLLALNVTAHFEPKIKSGIIDVEDIQDSVEEVLSTAGYADVAKSYICLLYTSRREHGERVDEAQEEQGEGGQGQKERSLAPDAFGVVAGRRGIGFDGCSGGLAFGLGARVPDGGIGIVAFGSDV